MVCSVYSVQVQCDNIPELVSVKRQAGKVFESVVVDPTRCDYCLNCAPLKGDEVDDSIELLELRRLADPAKHKSLVWPDLEFWNDTLYCAFREGIGHGIPGNGGDQAIIRIIASDDGVKWESAGQLTVAEDWNLMDARLSVTPDNRLMASATARETWSKANKQVQTYQSLSYFSADGRRWEGPYKVGDRNMILWRTTWHNGRAYNIGYVEWKEEGYFVRLYQSQDGKKFETLVDRLFDKNHPNEHAMVFLPDDTAMCLLRRDMQTVIGADYAMLGTARPPYTDWQWKTLNVKIGGPEMIRLPDGRLIACVRRYDNDLQYYPCWTELGWIDPETATYTTCLKLPSYDDTSYAGMVWHKGLLWVSYYSCHERGEGKANIYLAKIRVKPKQRIEASMPADSYQGKWVEGDGDKETFELLDKAFESFHVSSEMTSLPLLYKRDWDGFVESHTWNGWWTQNSYGPMYGLMPFLGQEPYRTWHRHANGLWFRMMGDGSRPGYHGHVAPDGALMDCANILLHGKAEDGVGEKEDTQRSTQPFDGSIWREGAVYRQGDGDTNIYDWFIGGATAGLIQECERLLMRRDPDEIAERLPQLKRVAAFLDSRRDRGKNLLKGGRSSNLLAPGYGGVKQPDGTYALAYLTELSVNYCAGLRRLAELCDLAGDKAAARKYRQTMAVVQEALPVLMEDGEYFIMSMDDDGTRHGVFGAEKHGYFESTPNHDAVAMGVVDDSMSRRIIAKMLSIPELNPFDCILVNYPEYDDNDNSIAKPYGKWVDGGAWETCQGRMSIACLRVNEFDQPLNAWKRKLRYMRAFRAVAAMASRGSAPIWDYVRFPSNSDVDCWGMPGGLLRGLFEYNYLSDRLQLRLHIPPGITRYIQKVPVWYGKTKIYITVTGKGEPKRAKANGKSCQIKNGWIILKPDGKEGNLCVEIVCGNAKESGAWKPITKPTLKLPDGPDFWEVEGFVSPIYEHVKVKTVYNFYEKMKKSGLENTYEGALARVVLEVLLARHNRIKGLEEGTITIPSLDHCPSARDICARYVKQARFMTGGLMDRLTGIAVWKEKVDPQIIKIAQKSGLLIPD